MSRILSWKLVIDFYTKIDAGGVAIDFRKSKIILDKMDMPENNYEILFTSGSMPNFSRKFVAICVYMHPSLNPAQVRETRAYLTDSILQMKEKYQDPFIAISGDFNNFNVTDYLDDFPDLVLLETSPSRGD